MNFGDLTGNIYDNLCVFTWLNHRVVICLIVPVMASRAVYSIDQFHKSQNAPVPYPTMPHSEQKCAHFCSEWCIVGYGTGAFWDLWIRSIDTTQSADPSTDARVSSAPTWECFDGVRVHGYVFKIFIQALWDILLTSRWWIGEGFYLLNDKAFITTSPEVARSAGLEFPDCPEIWQAFPQHCFWGGWPYIKAISTCTVRPLPCLRHRVFTRSF